MLASYFLLDTAILVGCWLSILVGAEARAMGV